MSMVVPVPGGQGVGPGYQPVRNAGSTPAATFSVPGATTHEPALLDVPDEVSAGVRKAADRYDELQRMNRQLHFRVSDGGEVIVDVCDLNGTVLRTIPSEEALEIIGGAPLA